MDRWNHMESITYNGQFSCLSRTSGWSSTGREDEDLTSQQIPDANGTTEEDRQLIGSLSLESYNFKPGGLAKKTLSIDVRGIRHHIISYYRVEDVKHGYYHRPTEDDFLSKVEPRPELLDNPSFKSPVEDRDESMSLFHHRPRSNLRTTCNS